MIRVQAKSAVFLFRKVNSDGSSQLARDVGRLLFHLAHSPLGPVLMKDFRREQFVSVGGTLKLSDVDDLTIGDPPCSTSDQCSLKDPTTDEILVTRESSVSFLFLTDISD